MFSVFHRGVLLYLVLRYTKVDYVCLWHVWFEGEEQRTEHDDGDEGNERCTASHSVMLREVHSC